MTEKDGEEGIEMDAEKGAHEPLTRGDDAVSPSKVKFTSASSPEGKNGGAKIDILGGRGPVRVGLSKEELMKYAKDPFWIRLRLFLFILFWVIWVAMFVGSILIIMTAPKCPASSNYAWYQSTSFYQVYVRSFKDSNNDGSGDINGIISKLDYLGKEIAVEALIMSPVYKMNGSDVIDFESVDSLLGTLADFDNLVLEKNSRKMKLIVDLVINSTSIYHPWFKKSAKKEVGFEDYFIWSKESTRSRSHDKERDEYYEHSAGYKSADLNLESNGVRNELKKIIKFWNQRGADGFRILDASHLSAYSVYDETANDGGNAFNKNKTLILLEELRTYLHKINPKAVLLADVRGPASSLKEYFGSPAERISDLALNFELMAPQKFNGKWLRDRIESVQNVMPQWPEKTKPVGPWTGWVIGGWRSSRLATRVGKNQNEALLITSFFIGKGTPIINYGDELGLVGRVDMASMPWLVERTTQPWLDIEDGTLIEEELKKNASTVQVFKELLKLRKEDAVTTLLGETHWPSIEPQDVNIFAMVRYHMGTNGYLILSNLGMSRKEIAIDKKQAVYLPDSGTIVLTNSRSPAITEKTIGLSGKINLAEGQTLLIRFAPIAPE